MTMAARARAGALLALAFSAWAPPAASAQCVSVTTVPCSLTDLRDVVFVGTLVSDTDEKYHFRVEEPFKGVRTPTLDVINIGSVEGDTGFNGTGKRYLVFATQVTMEDRTVISYVGGCGYQMVELSSAGALVDQLRRRAHGRRVASVFGRLTQQERDDLSLPAGPAVPNATVRLKSAQHTYTGRTRADGSYAIDGVAPGTYDLDADLPPGFEVGKIDDEDAAPLEIEGRSCMVADAVALPAGRISGRLIGPDGKPRDDTRADLFRADFVDPAGRIGGYRYGWVIGGKPFTFPHLQGGDYVLVFGADERVDPDNAFPRTFYRDSPDLERATIIHLAAGQRVLDADIHLPAPLPSRTVTIALAWNGHAPADYFDPMFSAGTDGEGPRAHANGDGTYSIRVLPGHAYAVSVQVVCRQGSGTLSSDVVPIDGGDASRSAITLTFPAADACRRE
jgi:hypothetical protein